MTTSAMPTAGGSFPALGFDPAPGSPAAVTTLAQDVHGTYTKLKAADDVLSDIIKGTGGWTGIAADAFTSKVRELPKILSEATSSFQRTSSALTDWQGQLSTMKQTAIDYETRAQQARSRLRDAEMNPDLHISGNFTPEEAAQMQRRVDQAVEQVNAANRDLEAIITEAKELLARHDEIAETIAQQVQKACEAAPDEPGFWDRLLDGIESINQGLAQLANMTWDWVKDHADNIANIGDVFSVMSTVTGIAGFTLTAVGLGVSAVFPPAAPVGLAVAGVGGVLEVTSGGLAAGALALHGVARLAGLEKVSDRTLIEDTLGAVSFGTSGAATAVLKGVSNLTGRGSAASGGLGLADNPAALEHFAPKDTRQAAEMALPGGPLFVALENAWNAG
ncbi:putative T7SS-secreted protein [Streptomyces sp. Da 82-17]|uniref:putative T7SS-secreted protein n=1 Tax=Streptomyces sp. Da 82-17 TaxID=3377116 RepID=UPI0038D4651E